MKIVFTIEEVKNIICQFVHKHEGEAPVSVAFIHRFSDGSGECDVNNVATIDRIEVEMPHPSSTQEKEKQCCVPDDRLYTSQPAQYRCKNCRQFWFAEGPTPICHTTK